MKVYIVICEMLDDEKYKVFRKSEDAETYLNAQIGKYFLQMLEDFNEDGDRDNFISEMNDAYTDLWKIFFETIAIRERANEKCQTNLFPLWTRKHAVEFMETSHN